mmetsp:Transcript_134769/g.238398  ORF Transcript_134769/g.238398 Transcript_134769/m.238398 type:complete len:320 (+) Transcript_134769:322-1281(+)
MMFGGRLSTQGSSDFVDPTINAHHVPTEGRRRKLRYSGSLSSSGVGAGANQVPIDGRKFQCRKPGSGSSAAGAGPAGRVAGRRAHHVPTEGCSCHFDTGALAGAGSGSAAGAAGAFVCACGSATTALASGAAADARERVSRAVHHVPTEGLCIQVCGDVGSSTGASSASTSTGGGGDDFSGSSTNTVALFSICSTGGGADFCATGSESAGVLLEYVIIVADVFSIGGKFLGLCVGVDGGGSDLAADVSLNSRASWYSIGFFSVIGGNRLSSCLIRAGLNGGKFNRLLGCLRMNCARKSCGSVGFWLITSFMASLRTSSN